MEEGFSLSFLDVLSLGLIGVIILYVITINSSYEITTSPKINVAIIRNISDSRKLFKIEIRDANDGTICYNTQSIKECLSLNQFRKEVSEKFGIVLNLIKNKDKASGIYSVIIDASEKTEKIEVLLEFSGTSKDSVQYVVISENMDIISKWKYIELDNKNTLTINFLKNTQLITN